MHEIILNDKATAMERLIAATMSALSGATMHLFPNLYVRPSTLFVKGLNRKDLAVVEIGTDKGYNARTILDNLDIKKMYLVDPYLETGLQGSSIAFEMAKKKIAPYRNKVEFIKKKSEDAINIIPSELDFLYIDGLHSKGQVALELREFYPKMKKGGVIAGHDYVATHIDLTEAVVEFAMNHKLELCGYSYDFWMVVK